MKKSLRKPLTRIFHPWWEWECYKAGFFNTTSDIDEDKARMMYMDFLADLNAFEASMDRVMQEWPKSCEHWLTNTSMNRVAWLGQAAMCIQTGVPAKYRSGYKLLTEAQQIAADALAQKYLDRWEAKHENQGKNQGICG